MRNFSLRSCYKVCAILSAAPRIETSRIWLGTTENGRHPGGQVIQFNGTFILKLYFSFAVCSSRLSCSEYSCGEKWQTWEWHEMYQKMASTLKPLRYYDTKMKKKKRTKNKTKQTGKQTKRSRKKITNKQIPDIFVCRYTAILSSGNQPLHYFYLNLLNELSNCFQLTWKKVIAKITICAVY